jgi:hypothetical protein
MRADVCRLAFQSDREIFSNPCTGSWILPGSPEQNENMVLAGIAVETPELLRSVRLTGKHAVEKAADLVGSRSLFLFITACPG